MSEYYPYWSLFLTQMLTICSINIIFYNNKWKSFKKAAAVSLFQNKKFTDINTLHKNSLKFIKVLMSTYFQIRTFIILIRTSKIFYIILSWNGINTQQAISRVHHLSKTGLSLSVKLFSSNAIFNMININHQIKWTLLIMYNNKYTENKDVVNLINFRNDELSEENNFNEVNDGIWEMKICKKSKILILNCSMFYFEFSFKNLYCTANHDVFLICFHLSTKIKEYSVNDTHT